MNLYISDLHFGHKNCIQYDKRPFFDVDEMDKYMIKLWNSRVFKDDNVYIIGDFAYRNERDETWYLRKLNGHKHLIIGNHDSKLINNDVAISYFDSVDKMMGISDNLNSEKVQVILNHYPMAEWYNSQNGSWHIYGHIHSDVGKTAQYMSSMEHALNAGCMINNYTPSSLNELIRNNSYFKEKRLKIK